jgi:hypothetical protein
MRLIKSNFFIVYPRKVIDELIPPEGWSCLYPGILADALRDAMKVKAMGTEMKIIWNEQHRWSIIKDYDITYEDLEAYLKADCSLLFFQTESLRNRTLKQLQKMGLKSDVASVDNYRDVLLQQATYHRTGAFSEIRSDFKELKEYITIEAFFTRGDIFGISPGQSSHTFYCDGYTDMAKTMKCLSSDGRRTGTPGKYRRWFQKYGNSFQLYNLFGHVSHKISKVKGAPELRELEYTATDGFTHTLKLAKDSITGTA